MILTSLWAHLFGFFLTFFFATNSWSGKDMENSCLISDYKDGKTIRKSEVVRPWMIDFLWHSLWDRYDYKSLLPFSLVTISSPIDFRFPISPPIILTSGLIMHHSQTIPSCDFEDSSNLSWFMEEKMHGEQHGVFQLSIGDFPAIFYWCRLWYA